MALTSEQKRELNALVDKIKQTQTTWIDLLKHTSAADCLIFERLSHLSIFSNKEETEAINENVLLPSSSNQIFEDTKVPKGNTPYNCLNESALREFSQDPCVFKIHCPQCNNKINNFVYKEHTTNCKSTETIDQTSVKSISKDVIKVEDSAKIKLSPTADQVKIESDAGSVNDKESAKDKPKRSRNLRSKSKIPVDVNKQCGVIGVSKNRCSRPLTCKTHTTEAKRKVEGRILPFDELLKQHLNNLEKIKMSKKTGKRKRRGAQPVATEEEEDIFDSDEETKLIMRALSQYTSAPFIVSRITSEEERIAYYRQKYASENILGSINE